jgi:hypothetical protein
MLRAEEAHQCVKDGRRRGACSTLVVAWVVAGCAHAVHRPMQARRDPTRVVGGEQYWAIRVPDRAEQSETRPPPPLVLWGRAILGDTSACLSRPDAVGRRSDRDWVHGGRSERPRRLGPMGAGKGHERYLLFRDTRTVLSGAIQGCPFCCDHNVREITPKLHKRVYSCFPVHSKRRQDGTDDLQPLSTWVATGT